SSPHTDKQRRWRAKKKNQHHRTQSSPHRLLLEQINESHQYSSDINENFENNVTVDNRIFDDNMVVHNSPMDDTHSDVTCAGGTFNDDKLVHDSLMDDTHGDVLRTGVTFNDDIHGDVIRADVTFNDDTHGDVTCAGGTFNDDTLVHDSFMDDTHADATCAGITFNDDIHGDVVRAGVIFNDDIHGDVIRAGVTFNDDIHGDVIRAGVTFNDDTYGDVIRAGVTFNDDTLVHDYILDDDDYNYSFDFNPNSAQSVEITAEQEDEPLYTNAPVTSKSYHKQILEFGNSVKLSDSNMNKLLQLIGNALPIENKLLKSYKKLLTAFKTTSTFNQELKCKYCLRIIDKTNSCSIICKQDKCQRRIGDVIEHVSVNRSYGQLIEIIRRNKHLILDYPQIANNLLPCDVISGSTYQEKRKNLKSLNGTYSVTLMIHIDGFQLVQWTKKHTWNSSVKPDANSLLDEICDTIKQTVIVDNINFAVDVLLFKADLPARALATKHVNHNAYFACLECDQEGIWYEEGHTVIYPYIPQQMNSRSSSHFDFCAEQVNQQLSCDDYYGIKGVSPLRKIMDIPNQIDIDIMHLCFIGDCNFLLCKWEKMIVKQSWLSVNDNNDDTQRHLSQEYLHQSYHDLQPVPLLPISQSTIDINSYDPLRSRQHNPTFENHRSANESLSTVIHSTTNNQNNCAPSPTVTGSPAKRRRTFPGQSNPSLTAPPIRKRFDPTLQRTAALLMENVVGGTTTSTARTTTAGVRSISEASQNGINQIIKPIVKLCEETNQLTKEVLQISTEQTNLTHELVNFPRELQKATQQLSHTVHMQAKVLQTRQQNDDEDVSIELNGINVSYVQRGASLNATARALVRAGYGEMASFNDLRPGESDILLGYLAYVHGHPPTTTFANSQAIKNSLQQMKHDIKKQTPNQSSKRNSTATQQIHGAHDDDEV
ncbi:unnamed protein product, partial [Rotaria sordida]